MAVETTNYQCPACTGPLHFDGATGKLVCDYCGSAYEVAEIEAMFAEAEKAADAEAAEAAKADDPFENWGVEEGMKAYSCPSCGAELICDETTAATSCPYCGNPTVVPGQFTGMQKPEFVIPFKLSKEDALKTLKAHYQGKALLPKAFADGNHLEEIKGVYVPFWLFDGKVSGRVQYEATKVDTRVMGNERIKRTSFFQVLRQGMLNFKQVPADASSKMPDEYMDAIEPFDYKELKPFSTAYLPGFLADKYDVEPESLKEHIEQRVKQSTLNALDATVKGYDGRSVKAQAFHVDHDRPKYALMPVWLLSTQWNGKSYLFAMNGQTGKMVSDLPVDMGKFWGIFAAIFVPLAVIMFLLMM